ncbi:MAG: purine-nucleoside phosphorylase [Bacteroidales bacterium]|jgi:purine-nucleoside phosphorylase|nr:purine-nucleoside phosphorylase [Bacteroidales bacterium]HQB20423.1 purine-nucleoside phosphorylase [Bacteroidales bacterium]
MLKAINSTVDYIRRNLTVEAKIAVVLGSGLNTITDEMTIKHRLPYKDIPNFPVSTVEGHQGNLLFGTLNSVPIIAMQGRFHYYEGYDMKQITFPIRIMKALGVEVLILSNASGGMNPGFNIGDIVVIDDHINFFPDNPLRGKNENTLGDRFPDMSEVYDKQIIKKIEAIAKQANISLKKGVYVGVPGPTYETPAEYKMFYRLGGDCVGMSTVPEAIVARHAGMKCVGFSVITDIWRENDTQKISHEMVLEEAAKAEPILRTLLKKLLTVI